MGTPNAVLEVAPSVIDAVVGWLEDARPRRLSGVTGRLLTEGLLDDSLLREFALGEIADVPGTEIDRDALAGFVLDELGYDDRVWATVHDDPCLASTDALTGELVLTHRLTPMERDRQAIPVVPDLVALDYRARAGLDLVGGGTLRVAHGSGPDRPGHDDSVLEGPEGWLAGLSPGEVIAFRRQGARVTVEPASALTPDDHVIRRLQDAAEDRIPAGGSEEAFPFVLDAMTMDAQAFRVPARPLGELLAAAGLERRGFSWGRQGTPWLDADQRARQFRRDLAARHYQFDRCCLAAYERVVEAVSTPDGGPDNVRIADDLSHGWVALAAAQEVLDFPDRPADAEADSGDPSTAADPCTDRSVRLEALARDVAEGSAPAAGLLVLALAAARRGEAAAAEAHLRQSLRDDPGYQPAARELVRCEIDRGDLDAAVRLIDHAGAPFPAPIAALVRRLHDALTTPNRTAGRNQRCPCGSGRKYKACCLRDPRLSPRMRAALLDLRLAVFTYGGHRERLFALTTEILAATSGGQDAVSFRPVETDIQSFEGGLAVTYLAEHGALLPDQERAILQAAIDEPRRLWEIIGTGPGDRITLRDAATGRAATVDDPIAATPASVGTTVLWRIARHGTTDYPLGYPVEVNPDQRDELQKLLAADPTANNLLAWYHKTS